MLRLVAEKMREKGEKAEIFHYFGEQKEDFFSRVLASLSWKLENSFFIIWENEIFSVEFRLS